MDVIEAIRKPRHRVSLYVNTRGTISQVDALLPSTKSVLSTPHAHGSWVSFYTSELLSRHVKSSYLAAGSLLFTNSWLH